MEQEVQSLPLISIHLSHSSLPSIIPLPHRGADHLHISVGSGTTVSVVVVVYAFFGHSHHT